LTPPAAWPNSAEKVEVCTLNSSMTSISGSSASAFVLSEPTIRFLSIPSSR
jgi:hypothetical protein